MRLQLIFPVSAVATLSAPVGFADGTDHALISVDTNIGAGDIYWIVSDNTSTASAAQIIAGHDQGGGAADAAGTFSVSGTGTQPTVNPSGLSGVTTYAAQFVHVTDGGNSNVVKTSSFPTGGTLTINATTTAAWQAAGNRAEMDAVLANVLGVYTSTYSPSTDLTLAPSYDWGSISGSGSTSPNSPGSTAYASVLVARLQGLPNQNSLQRTFFANLPANDPFGVSDNYYMTSAQSLATGGSGGFGGGVPQWTTTLNSGSTWDFTEDGSFQGGNGSALSFWSTCFHETGHGFGRFSGILGISPFNKPSVLDLMSYSSAGVRNVTTTGTRYPSHDGGTTNIITPNSFQQSEGSASTSDLTANQADPYHSTAVPGVAFSQTVGDIKLNTLLGWGLTHAGRVAAGL